MSRAELNLDQLLADMAEDVPPMPADFHGKWVSAVRTQAGKPEEKQPETPVAAPVSLWPKLLSLAAVFMFLIGGTFVYRSSRKTILPQSKPAVTVLETEKNGSLNAAGDAEEANDAGKADYAAMGAAGEAGSLVMNSAMESAAEAPERRVANQTVMAKRAEEADYAEEAPEMEMAEEAPETVSGSAVPEAEKPAVEMPEASSASAVPAAEKPAFEASAPVSAERSGLSGFFADMGDFLLVVWPYLLLALALLAIAAGIRKFRKK